MGKGVLDERELTVGSIKSNRDAQDNQDNQILSILNIPV
jgi:hypothetical protein